VVEDSSLFDIARFSDPSPDRTALAVIDAGLCRVASFGPDVSVLRDRFRAPKGGSDRELYLDAAATLLGLADRQWRAGRVLEALALEGLEARLLELVVAP
jgi:hypothetical protein